jgi:uncharacterized protein involved in exopolysaccharide biosynthesis
LSLAELRRQSDALVGELRDDVAEIARGFDNRLMAAEQRLDRLEARLSSIEQELAVLKGKKR